MYSCHLFLISSASVRSFIEPIFAWNVPLVSLIFLKRSLIFPILLFSSISLHWSLRKAFLSLLAILWNSAFRCLYLSFSPLLFASVLFTAICKASLDSHFAFLHFVFLAIPHVQVKRNPSKTVGVARGHQRADTLKPYSQKTSQSNYTRTTVLSNSMKLSYAVWGHPRWEGHGGEVWQNVVHWRRQW